MRYLRWLTFILQLPAYLTVVGFILGLFGVALVLLEVIVLHYNIDWFLTMQNFKRIMGTLAIIAGLYGAGAGIDTILEKYEK